MRLDWIMSAIIDLLLWAVVVLGPAILLLWFVAGIKI